MAYKIYWNNVCLLGNMEKAFIDRWMARHNDMDCIFEYYGLGRRCAMLEKIRSDLQEGEIKADVVVSTDLDVFQRSNMAGYFSGVFRQDASLLPAGEHILRTNIPHPAGCFHPFIVVPLVMVINTHRLESSKMPERLEDLLHPDFKGRYAFGGIHNSAGRSLLKALWYLYGSRAAEQFASGAIVTPMPVQAFQKVISGETAVAVVPTIFAQRQGVNGLSACWPAEGAVAVPSYVAVKKAVPQADFQRLREGVLGPEHQQQLRDAGDIVPADPGVPPSSFARENGCRLLYPEWDFFRTFDHDQFDALCEKYAPPDRNA